MLSRSSRQKNALKTPPSELVSQLLQDGARITSPSSVLLATAASLREKALIELSQYDFVKCANHEDGDFPPRNRHCSGRIYLPADESTSRVQLQCPSCERSVYPDNYQKRRFVELRIAVSQQGVVEYLKQSVAKLQVTVKTIAEGVFRVDVGRDGVTVCIVDYCADAEFLSRDRAADHPTCFIAVNPRDYDAKFLNEAWIKRASLADIVCERVDLAELVTAASTSRPATLLRAAVPVVTKGPLQLVSQPVERASAKRLFVVEVGPDVVRVEGIEVIARQGKPRFLVFRALAQWFLEDLQIGKSPSEFRAWTLNQITAELDKQEGRRTSEVENVRRVINNIQSDIEAKLKKQLGIPIGREDIIQSCRWKGQSDGDYGYRINPSTVAIRPYQEDLSEES